MLTGRKLFCLPAVAFLCSSLHVCAGVADTRLVKAAKERDDYRIRVLLLQHVDVNAPDADGSTALHWAVHLDDSTAATNLINTGANVRQANRYSVTPLSLACANGNGDMIELLLNAGAEPNTTLPGGETALMTAARSGSLEGVRTLLDHGAMVNAHDESRGQTALMWAAAEGHNAIVKTLLERGADPLVRSKAGFTAFLFAVREGKIDVVRTLIDAGIDVNSSLPATSRSANANALTIAVANAHYALATLLLNVGGKDAAPSLGWTVLHQISWVRKPGAGANLLQARGSGEMDSLDFVRELVRHGADVNARITKKPYSLGTTNLNTIGATPFLMAAKSADGPLMKLLVELGADPQLTTADQTTALMAAAGVGTYEFGEDPGTEEEVYEAVTIALDLGGDVNAVDRNGETAMHGAAYKEVPSVVRLLLDRGAKIEVWNRKNRLGWVPLRISEGVTRGQNVRHRSPETAAVIRRAMSDAGVSTVVEPEEKVSVAEP